MPVVDTKISALPAATTLSGGEKFPVVQGGTTLGCPFPFSADLTAPASKVGLGGAVSSSAMLALTSRTSRDGWGAGGTPWFADCLRTIDSNATANPLHFGARFWTTVPNTVTAAAREWTVLAIAEDFSGLCDMVALTGQGRRNSGSNGMWAGQFNMIDYADPTTATNNAIGIEVNIQGDGDDTLRHRNILYAVAHRVNFAAGWQSPVGTNRHFAGMHIATGTADLHYGVYMNAPVGSIDEGLFLSLPNATHAIHINAGSDFSDSIVQIDSSITAKFGVRIQSTLSNAGSAAAFQFAGVADYGLLIPTTATIGWAGVSMQANGQYGLLTTGTYAVGAFGMNADEYIYLGSDTTSTQSIRMKFNNTSRAIEFYRGATLKQTLSMI